MSQQFIISPELRKWVLEQTQAGCHVVSLLKSLIDAKYSTTHSLFILNTVLNASDTNHSELNNIVNNHIVNNQNNQKPKSPTPDLNQSPNIIQTSDRAVHVLLHLQKPPIVLFGNVLSDEECDALIEQAKPLIKRSLTVGSEPGAEQIHEGRTSQGMFFRRGQSELVTRIEERLAQLLQWPIENGEGLQVLCYGVGAQYKPHYDYFDPAHKTSEPILRRGGQRVGTIVLYLNDPKQGGGTIFPQVAQGLEVHPRKGNAVFFAYDAPNPESQSLHGGSPVLAGEKWIATKWLREREFI